MRSFGLSGFSCFHRRAVWIKSKSSAQIGKQIRWLVAHQLVVPSLLALALVVTAVAGAVLVGNQEPVVDRQTAKVLLRASPTAYAIANMFSSSDADGAEPSESSLALDGGTADDSNVVERGVEPDSVQKPSDLAAVVPATDPNTVDTQPIDSGVNEVAATSRPMLSGRSDRAEATAEPTPPARPLTAEETFIAKVVEPAQLSQKQTGVPTSVTIAQAILESNWGNSRLARDANNYFGIKAREKSGSAGVIYIDTWEFLGGKNITVSEPFRAYASMIESFIDHGLFFQNSRYALAMQNAADPRQFARLIHKAGYATDPSYSDKLIALMDKFNLYIYDLQS
ncbi:MAG: glucosaminidase domain-containing protein [Chloroflexi bacterium]|nr:glucosaminidase domain-containing protein [Chloroflexota bacterium]